MRIYAAPAVKGLSEQLLRTAFARYIFCRENVYSFINPLSAKHDYSSFWSVLLADQITVIGNEMSSWTSRFANILSQIKQTSIIFTHLMLWVSVASHKWNELCF